MTEMYREFSRTLTPEGEEVYADTDIMVHKWGALYRVRSKTTPTCINVHLDTGNVESFFRALTQAKRAIMEHDRRERERKPIPKPVRTAPSPLPPACPMCGGYGYVTDEWGYDVVCECRR